MKRIVTAFLVSLSAACVFAQEPLPLGVAPLKGKIQLLLVPEFESSCTIRTTEEKDGESGKTQKSSTSKYKIFEDSSGIRKAAIRLDIDEHFVQLTFDVKANGAGFLPKEPIMQFDSMQFDSKMLDADKSMSMFADFFKKISKNMTKASEKYFEQAFQQGSEIAYDNVCELFGAQTKVQNGHSAVVGTAIIRGRESLVVSGDQTRTCVLGNDQLIFQVRGWEARDIQSGLPIAASSSVITKDKNGKTSGTEDIECSIVGDVSKTTLGATSANTISVKSAEQRITELKSLLSKELITKEQFEKKRAEILNEL